MTTSTAPPNPFEVLASDTKRVKRVSAYRVRELLRRLCDISAQVEAAALEVCAEYLAPQHRLAVCSSK